MRVGLVRDPRLAHDGLQLQVFRDETGTRERPGRSGEQAACAYWLEHRLGPPGRSTSDLEPVIGRSLSPIDVEGTTQAIERAIAAALPREWRAVTVVATGWRVSVTGLRQGDWLDRAGLPTRLPEGLSRWTLQRRAAQLRRELVACGLIERSSAAAMDAIENREGVTAMQVGREQRLQGWKQIGGFLGVSEDTVARWHTEESLPVYRASLQGRVWAYPDELREWEAARAALCGTLR